MSALKSLALLALLAACEGPTLYVGDLQQPVLDAGEPDDAALEVDATFDATLPDARVVMRDAGGDGRVETIIVQLCNSSSDCRDPRYPKCNTAFSIKVCTGCQTDRDCKQTEYCDNSPYVWQCRDHKDDPVPTNGSP